MFFGMDCLDAQKRSTVIAALVDGVSISATCGMTGVAKHTVLKLLKDIGCAAATYNNARVLRQRVRRVHKTLRVTTRNWKQGLRIMFGHLRTLSRSWHLRNVGPKSLPPTVIKTVSGFCGVSSSIGRASP
jgi:hypothetical protein